LRRARALLAPRCCHHRLRRLGVDGLPPSSLEPSSSINATSSLFDSSAAEDVAVPQAAPSAPFAS
jgi:hypothetical protein